jgi:cytidine deaminase
MLKSIADEELIAAASALVGLYQPSSNCVSGTVAAALRTRSGKIYTGICVDTACSMGFCAEHSAVAEMLKAHEAEVETIVAVSEDSGIIAPCGRCRELLWQLHLSNRATRVIISPDRTLTLSELLPEPWHN